MKPKVPLIRFLSSDKIFGNTQVKTQEANDNSQ